MCRNERFNDDTQGGDFCLVLAGIFQQGLQGIWHVHDLPLRE